MMILLATSALSLLAYIFDWVRQITETPHDQQSLKEFISFKNASLLIFFCLSVMIIGITMWLIIDSNNRLNSTISTINKLSMGDLNFELDNISKNDTGKLLAALKALGQANKKISDTLTALSKGDFTVFIEPRSTTDTLGIALINMISKLKHLIGEIQNQMTNLMTSSETILNSIAQVATQSEETAATVTETTTSVEELQQTAHLTNERAQEMVTSSEATLQIVSTNEKLLQATLEEMRQISEKMSIISESIVKLSEHGKAIGNIIDTVNDLSEQSNLLAVNAAIEAAKAGEHGKNFTVVAQEIRLLAEQSKSATIQVRSILNEIQNATSVAVMAAEQGTKAVEKGVKQSAETNKSMQMLSVSMSRMTQSANQISVSSQQQFVGVEQMTIAMDHINKSTAQLVDHMQQIESAVMNLNFIGKTIKELTDQYKLTKENKSLIKNKKNITIAGGK